MGDQFLQHGQIHGSEEHHTLSPAFGLTSNGSTAMTAKVVCLMTPPPTGCHSLNHPPNPTASGRVNQQKEREMSDPDLAKHIAREIFTCGTGFKYPVTRIEFKSKNGDKERSQGGLCESALISVIRNAIKTAKQTAPERKE